MEQDNVKQVHLYIEEHQGSLYAWRKNDHRFMGQGETVAKLFERLHDDVPDGETVMFKIAVDEGGDILHARAQSEGVA